MKKGRYFPFERNRYFYGKLLTVRDFESEQTYFNDKRRLLNRLLHGSGVVAGLQVVAVDDKSISVQMGVALDRLGREIVVSAPVTLKLSMIEGFSNNEYAKNVYLCIAYDEKGKEPVHSVAGSSVREEEVNEYNRMQEGYKLFIKEEAPDPSIWAERGRLEDVSVLYQDDHVRILHILPRYVNPEEVVEARIVIEKTLQTPQVSVHFSWQCDAFAPIGPNSSHTIQFREPGNRHESTYVHKYYLKTAAGEERREAFKLIEGATVSIGDNEASIGSGTIHEVDLISEKAKQQQLQEYYDRSLDESLVSSPDYLYLAKISLLQMGATYMIEKVEQVPFGEYVYSTTALMRMGWFQDKDIPDFEEKEPTPVEVVVDDKVLAPLKREWTDDIHEALLEEVQDTQTATGHIEFELDQSPKSKMLFFKRDDHTYFSEEIVHGLGTGNVQVMIGLEELATDMPPGVTEQVAGVYYGNHHVFKNSEFEAKLPGVETGVIVYPQKGTFRIGVKVQKKGEKGVLRLRWWALRKSARLTSQNRDVSEEEAAASKNE